MNSRLLKLKKELIKAIKPNKEDLMANNLNKALVEARASIDDTDNRYYYLNRLVEAFNIE